MTAPRIVRCRVLDKFDNRCTAEALDPDGEILICLTHTAAVMRLVQIRTTQVKPATKRTRARAA